MHLKIARFMSFKMFDCVRKAGSTRGRRSSASNVVIKIPMENRNEILICKPNKSVLFIQDKREEKEMFQRLRKKLRKQAHEETEPFSRNSVTPRDEVSPDQSSKVEIKKRNLWEIAFRKLDEIERKHLAVEKADPISKVLEGVIDHTKEKYGMYKKGDLQIRDRSISMRNSVKNIISFTLQAQDLINGIVSLDQTGYGE